ncbi:hypothetical protein FMUAM8_42880 [Nocardia cyriacigeorgica]|nr:hypothetical protein FMUAM8_42880 [Nocardia cyriacigeorgica]
MAKANSSSSAPRSSAVTGVNQKNPKPPSPKGRLRTGDSAVVDEQGWVYLVDRIKDQINVSGYKEWPREVEDVLYEHPAVLEAAVVGVPDEYRGESVTAYVSLRGGYNAKADELISSPETDLHRTRGLGLWNSLRTCRRHKPARFAGKRFAINMQLARQESDVRGYTLVERVTRRDRAVKSP